MTVSKRIDILVVGAGGAGLTAGYSLRALGLEPLRDFMIVDEQPGPGATWRHGWDFLKVGEGLKQGEIHDLPGQAEIDLSFGALDPEARIRDALPMIWRGYQDAYDLFVAHSTRVRRVDARPRRDELTVTLEIGGRVIEIETYLLINATGRWSSPFVPWYRGQADFAGEQRHAQRLESFQSFAGKRVLVVGGGRVAVMAMLELERIGATPIWSTRRKPDFHERPRFALVRDQQLTIGELGLESRQRVSRLVVRGKQMPSDVAVRGIPLTRDVFDAIRRGTLSSRGRVERFGTDHAEFFDGTTAEIDAILWATGGRDSITHLAPLGLRDAGGTPKIRGGWSRRDPRVAFLGYGPGVETVDVLKEALTMGEDAIDRLVG